MFHYLRIPYSTCIFFTRFTYNEYIGPYFFIARCSTIFASELPELDRGLGKYELAQLWLDQDLKKYALTQLWLDGGLKNMG
jgi:hypothetical protein